jgi:hypothetical protein
MFHKMFWRLLAFTYLVIVPIELALLLTSSNDNTHVKDDPEFSPVRQTEYQCNSRFKSCPIP